MFLQLPLSLMFAAAAEPADGGTGAGTVATTTLLPRTVSMRTADEVTAALRVLRLPDDMPDRIRFRRSMDVFKRKPVPAPSQAATGITKHPATDSFMHGAAERAQEGSRERASQLQHEETSVSILDQEHPDVAARSDRELLRGARTGCTVTGWRSLKRHTATQPQVLALADGGQVRGTSGGACSHMRVRCLTVPTVPECEREQDLQHGHVPLGLPTAVFQCPGAMGHHRMSLTAPGCRPPMHATAQQQPIALQLPTLVECEVALHELLSTGQ